MKRFVQLAACGLMLVASTGCCWHNWGGGGCGGGCSPYGCGYNSGGQYGYGPTGYATGTAMSAGVPVYTANAPIMAPTTAGLNPLPTY